MRILVDRLWPRGIRKEKAKVDYWARTISPSNDLRKWYGHDPAKWEEFKKRGASIRESVVLHQTLNRNHIINYMERISMAEKKSYRYGLANPKEVAGMTGKELLQAIIDGRLPQAPILPKPGC